MRRNRLDVNPQRHSTPRRLRLEDLERREMLSVSPLDAPVENAVVAAAPDAVAVAEPIALSLADAEQTDAALVFEATGAPREYTLSWNAVDGYDAYHVKISRDGGETWITYKKSVDDLSCLVKGLYAGNEYSFRVYGLNAKGTPVAATMVEGSFAPISISANATVYRAGETITVDVLGADSASVDLHWYQVTADGDVEIEEAAGLAQYTPANADVAIKVVATGSDLSLGSNDSVTVSPVDSLDVEWSVDTRQAAISWNAAEGAVKYKVMLSRNGGATYGAYTTTTETTAALNGLYAGHEYAFRTIAYDAAGKVVAMYEQAFVPFKLSVSASTYHAGDTITAAITDGAEADIRWYLVTDDGDVEIAEAAGQTSYTPDSANYSVKVVATGTGDSVGCAAEATITAAQILDAGVFNAYHTSNRNVETVWNLVDDAAKYNFYKLVDGVWKKTTSITVADGEVTSGNAVVSEDGSKIIYTVNMLDVNAEGNFRTVAYDAAGKEIVRETYSYKPFGVQLSADGFAAGTTITATVSPELADYAATWSMYDAEADAWQIVASGLAITVDEALADAAALKLVVVDNATERVTESFVYPIGYSAAGETLTVVLDETTNLVDMTFKAIDGVDLDGYELQYYYDDADYPVWLTMQSVSFADNGDGTIAATRAGGAALANREIRVRARQNDVVSEWFGLSVGDVENLAREYSADDDAVTLSWDPVANADAIRVYALVTDLTGAETTVEIANLDGAATSCVCDVDLNCAYSFVVEASRGETTSSNAVDFVAVVASVSPKKYTKTSLLTATLQFDALVSATYQWVGVTADGEDVLIDGATGSTLQMDEALFDAYAGLKLVVAGADAAEGTRSVVDVEKKASEYESPSIVVNTLDDVLNPTDELISLREAIVYQRYLRLTGEIDDDVAITFDPAVFTEENSTIFLAGLDSTQTYTNPDVSTYRSLRNGGAFDLAADALIDASALGFNVTIDASESASRIFYVNGHNLEVTGLTLQNATQKSPNYGGAVWVSNGSLTLNDCLLQNNTSINGGAIFVNGGDVTANNTTFLNNGGTSTTTAGGAIYFYSTTSSATATCKGTLTITGNSAFIGNSASSKGGAIHIGSATIGTASNQSYVNLVIEGDEENRVRFENNYAGLTYAEYSSATGAGMTYGAAIYANYSVNLTIDNADFVANRARYGGAAITVWGGAYVNAAGEYIGGKVLVENSTFADNYLDYTAYGGAAVFLYTVSSTTSSIDATFDNCEFTDNYIEKTYAASHGGAVYLLPYSTGTLSANFLNSSFVGNGVSKTTTTKPSFGGAIASNTLNANPTSALYIDGCTFDSNASECGAAVAMKFPTSNGVAGKGYVTINNSVFTDTQNKAAGVPTVQVLGNSTTGALNVLNSTFDGGATAVSTTGTTRNVTYYASTLPVTIANTLVKNTTGAGLIIYSPANIVNCTIADTAQAGIVCSTARSTISNTIVWNCGAGASASTHGITSYTAVTLNNVLTGGSANSISSWTGNLWVAAEEALSPLDENYRLNPATAIVLLDDGTTQSTIDAGGDGSLFPESIPVNAYRAAAANQLIYETRAELIGDRIHGSALDLGAFEYDPEGEDDPLAILDEIFAEGFDD